MTELAERHSAAPTLLAMPAAPPPPHPVQAPGPTARRRLRSLDALRGLAIVGMLLVDDAGLPRQAPTQLRHTAWNGLHAADLVFPLFLFAVGTSMAFSSRSQRPRAVARRAVLLVLLGCLEVSAKHHHLGPSTGVLQHIAVAYVVAWAILRLPAALRRLAGATLLIGYAAALVVGGTQPGTNVAAVVDRALLGHVATEGILPAVASAVSVLLGCLAGQVLRDERSRTSQLRRLALLGAVTLVAGLALAPVVPINKHLWSPSFALVTTGICAFVMAVLVQLVDRAGVRPRPLNVLGANAIAIYVVSILVFRAVIPESARAAIVADVVRVASPGVASVAYGVMAICACWALAEVMYRRRIFLRV